LAIGPKLPRPSSTLPAADKPFDNLAAIQNEIPIAAKWLIKTYRDVPLKDPPQKSKWEATIGWGLDDEDSIAMRLDAAVADAERLCRPHLMLGNAA
jgi:hypothetical protein